MKIYLVPVFLLDFNIVSKIVTLRGVFGFTWIGIGILYLIIRISESKDLKVLLEKVEDKA